MKRKLNYIVGLIGCCCVALLGASAQERKIRAVGQIVTEGPVELVDLNIEGQTAKLSDNITAGKGWLKSLKLNFKNTYSKNIVYMDVELEIAKTGNMLHPLRLPVRFGRLPESASHSLNAPEKLSPNGKIKVALSEDTVAFLEQFMRENQVDEIDGVTIFVEFIVFDDDTAWSKGHSMRRDTNNPERWTVNGVWRDGRILFHQKQTKV